MNPNNYAKLELFRTRWRRWLGNKCREDKPFWTDLLDVNWSSWAKHTIRRHGIEKQNPSMSLEEVKKFWLFAIGLADDADLQKLDALYCERKSLRRRRNEP